MTKGYINGLSANKISTLPGGQLGNVISISEAGVAPTIRHIALSTNDTNTIDISPPKGYGDNAKLRKVVFDNVTGSDVYFGSTAATLTQALSTGTWNMGVARTGVITTIDCALTKLMLIRSSTTDSTGIDVQCFYDVENPESF